jgi:hypothetical protein
MQSRPQYESGQHLGIFADGGGTFHISSLQQIETPRGNDEANRSPQKLLALLKGVMGHFNLRTAWS